MIEQIPVFTPPMVFPATQAGGEGAKCVLRLEDLLVGYGPLPPVVKIVRMVMSNEGAGDDPAGCAGKIDVAVDPRRRYSLPARFPTVERIQPRHPKLLASLQTYPGRKKLVSEYHNPPICYRRDADRIIVAPNIYGNFAATIALYLTFYIESDCGDWSLDPATVYLNDIVASTGASPQPMHTYRTVVGPSPGGAKVRVHNTAHEHGAGILSQFVGVQAAPGSPATVGQLVPLLLDGQQGIVMPPWAGHWRAADLVTQPGEKIVVITTVSGAWGYTDEGGGPTWWEGNGGSGYQPTRTHAFDCVQVI